PSQGDSIPDCALSDQHTPPMGPVLPLVAICARSARAVPQELSAVRPDGAAQSRWTTAPAYCRALTQSPRLHARAASAALSTPSACAYLAAACGRHAATGLPRRELAVAWNFYAGL